MRRLVLGVVAALSACAGGAGGGQPSSYLQGRWDGLDDAGRAQLCLGWHTEGDRLISVLGQDEYRDQLADKGTTPADIRAFLDEHC